jgi:hypothetical protein
MTSRWLILGALFVLIGCSSSPTPSSHQDATDAAPDITTSDAGQADDGWSQEYRQDCIGYEFWFCPPLSAIWQKQVIFDRCVEVDCDVEFCTDSGFKILEIGECVEYLECNPQVHDLGTQECKTWDGHPGEQDVRCNKGHLWYGPCRPCDGDEVCDGLDNDCNGKTDEGDYGTCDSQCGEGPLLCVDGTLECGAEQPGEEVCDYKDNDCDGETDEGELNDCGACGPEPSEVCDNKDNDCDGDTDEDLVASCVTPCGTGYRTCTAGSWSPCSAKQPYPEQCNLIDDDCDGDTDEDLECGCTEDQIGALFPCAEDPLICGQGFKQCQCADGTTDIPCDGDMLMSECHAMCFFDQEFEGPCVEKGTPTGEKCNNFDDDCDVLIDEDLAIDCYSGPPETLDVGICHGGHQVCVAGEWGWETENGFIPGICYDEVVPQGKDYCNGEDENCDGIADDGKEMQPTDICFLVDWSGSMLDEINAVFSALALFAAHYSDEEVLQWCLVLAPLTVSTSDILYRATDLVPFSEFQLVVGDLDPSWVTGGNEMLMDALWMMLGGDVSDKTWKQWTDESDPPKDEFGISWRGGDVKKLIVLWTDEKPQTYLSPSVYTADLTSLMASTANLSLYTFTPAITSVRTPWENFAEAAGGSWLELTDDEFEMYVALMGIFDEAVCE